MLLACVCMGSFHPSRAETVSSWGRLGTMAASRVALVLSCAVAWEAALGAPSRPLFIHPKRLQQVKAIWHATRNGTIAASTSNEQETCMQVKSLLEMAERHMEDKPFTVTDKEGSINETATPRHYQSSGFYDWRGDELVAAMSGYKSTHGIREQIRYFTPNGAGRGISIATIQQKVHANPEFGRRWFNWDGRPGPRSESEADSTRSKEFMGNATMYAIAEQITGDARYLRKLRTLVKTWFLNETTSMLPNLDYAQASRPPGKSRRFGVIELKDMWQVMDLVFLVMDESRLLSPYDQRTLQKWCASYRNWLADHCDCTPNVCWLL